MIKKKRSNREVLKFLTLAIVPLSITCTSVVAQATDAESEGDANSNIKVGGYLRGWASWNLADAPDVPGDDKRKLSMLRGSASLNASAKTGDLTWSGIVRADVEGNTRYQRDLQKLNQTNTPGGPGADLMKELRNADLREFYVDANLGDRVKLRLGKQQIVWGETDFFHPSDVIHGFDYRWRQFLEGEGDELRKPLILVNAKIDVPEANGNLQILVRPGLDRKKDIGNTYDLYGGRWMPQPYRGNDFLTILPYDYEHPKGNYKDVTGGFRWVGSTDKLNYSFSYVTTFQGDPVINPVTTPYYKTPTGVLGNFIFPKISVASASVSGEISAIDAVLNAEIAFQQGNLYNSDPNAIPLPGWGAVVKKDVVKTTLRADKQLRLMDWLGTNQASFASVQLFDSWIKNFKSYENAVAFGGYPAKLKEHDTVLTAFIVLNYMNSKLNPQLAVGRNLSTGDAFIIPSISYQYGNNWRISAEADLFYTKHQPLGKGAKAEQSYPLSDFLSNHDQLLIRATYQF